MDNLIIIKLGGSAITVKEKRFTAREDVIQKAAKNIKTILERNWKIILIHGGGSFGHPVAKQYDTQAGLKNTFESRKGYLLTRLAMLKLDEIVTKIFLEEGVPVAPLHTSCLAVASNGILKELYSEPIRLALSKGFIPLLQGDVVLDLDKGFSIVSGDQIAFFLTKMFKPKIVVFGLDVKGLYTRPPYHPQAKLIKKLSKSLNICSEVKTIDVTGGIISKIKYAFKIRELGSQVYFCSLLDNSLLQIVNGEEGEYTEIL
ncbi:MAG TPA: isopentenyl phosphate kinase family protein [Thermoproteales archaeon]|nr:isopentenyl phosphate kinase family protein [Thermoproteales archaeon]